MLDLNDSAIFFSGKVVDSIKELLTPPFKRRSLSVFCSANPIDALFAGWCLPRFLI